MNATLKYWLREIGIVVLSALIIFFLLQTTLMKAEVIGESMEPNLYRGEQVLINKMAYNFGTPERGDIIVFDPP
ncbi:MAG: signal peptidase I, partial [Dehalococcoidaceae bacterium]|nr:signal peptidase I [Dehalococcoidaceae bacterium]